MVVVGRVGGLGGRGGVERGWMTPKRGKGEKNRGGATRARDSLSTSSLSSLITGRLAGPQDGRLLAPPRLHPARVLVSARIRLPD